ncbi:DNA polymerase III subunit epsilon [Maritimibacter sp. DP1N21-5]|uniref:DNA polymerase III subunit epsilon n=1 Tax=Maritimibacter sp. DP1N21-5 TaxID=2836867 RepID=UPI001C46ACD8|nr:DNA polymerase III subunit epsilon [Maritimibacter sp. DP1N21-5]MBV7411022.1 DNA polymerase III subunit epsilon [Maritimibacter sp. DP1N21-5]
MREIVMDTETTGFDPKTGDRMVEIGCVELINHMPTGKTFHQYINPERDMPEGAFAVHGLSAEFLRDFPTFKEIAQSFLDFIGTDKLIIHNAGFDIPFLNAELGWCMKPQIPMDRAIDTLLIARKKYPGAGNSLDALCRRFGIDNAHRTLHGALLDSEILADVYLELIGGRQPDLVLGGGEKQTETRVAGDDWRPRPRPTALPSRLTDEERAAHDAFVAKLGENAIWKRFAAN